MLPLGTPLDTSLKELEDVGMRRPLSVNLPVGGRLRHFWPIWQRMRASRRVAQVRISPPIRPILRRSKGSSSSIPASSGQFNRKLSRSVKTVNFKRDVDIVTSETVRNSHVRGGGRVLLPGIPRTEEERRLSLSNGSLRAKRVAFSSDVYDGHAQSREGHGGNPALGPPVLQSGVVTRSSGLRISDGSVRSPPSPQSPDKSNSGGSTRSRSQLVDSSTRSTRGSYQVVVEGGCDVSRDVVSSSGARGGGVHRRVHKRMGRIMRRSKLARKVAAYRTSHKLVGDEDGTCSPPDSPVSPTTEGSTDLDRQFHHGGVSQEGRRHAISSSSPSLSSHPEVGLRPADPIVPTAYRRPPECVSRLSVENGASDSVGVGGSASNVQMDMRKFSMGSSGSGSLREQSKSSSPLLRIAVPGLGSVGDGRSDMLMAAEGNLRFPADVFDTPIPTSSQAFRRVSVPTSSPVVSAGQVDTSANVVSGNTLSANSGIEGDAGPTTLGVSPPISAQSPATSVVPSWGSLRKLGFSERVVDRIINARAASTNKQYKSKWDYFVSWSTSSGRDPLAASLPLLTEFLVHVFNDRKVSVRTLKNYRSATAFYWRSNVGYELPDQDPVLSDLFRSFKRERPLPRPAHRSVGYYTGIGVFSNRVALRNGPP